MEKEIQDLENIRKKLLEQIQQQYDSEKAKGLSEKIKTMNDEEFIEFLKSQGLIQDETGNSQQCIFCALAKGEMPRTEYLENEKAIAILELNPISKGHSLIIPKEHIESEKELPEEAINLAQKAKEELERTFKPQRIDIMPNNIMGHEIINILPIYSTENINSPRKKETPENLAKIKDEILNSKPEEIKEKEKPTEIKTEKEITQLSNPWFKPRIP